MKVHPVKMRRARTQPARYEMPHWPAWMSGERHGAPHQLPEPEPDEAEEKPRSCL